MKGGQYTERDCIDAIIAGMMSRALVPVAAPRLHRSKTTRRVLATDAQDETSVHLPFWRHLHLYADYIGAEVVVGGTTYQKGLFEDHSVRTGVFATEVQPFLSHEQVEIGPVLFCAEMNILPTAVNPLSGLQTYSRARPAVFPHVKHHLESVPAMANADVPILCTTGACTIPNYVEKKAGQKARFHHIIGATLIEVDEDGDWFFRHINAEPDGTFQDLDVLVSNGQVTTGHRVEAITWGDVHREQLDAVNAMTAWGVDVATDTCVTRDTMLDALRPRHQFFHDLLDFRARNHHSRWDPHHLFEMVANGTSSVEEAVRSCARFLRASQRSWCQSVVIESNHDRALLRWLKEGDWRTDPTNARPFLRWNGKVLAALEAGDKTFNVFREALREADDRGLVDIDFVPVDGSYLVAGNIENGMHGDFGSNGARGSLVNLTRLSMKTNTGHVHTAGIRDSSFCAGMNGRKNQGYNHGPSSWTATDIVTYANGKRTLVTKRGSKWRAA